MLPPTEISPGPKPGLSVFRNSIVGYNYGMGVFEDRLDKILKAGWKVRLEVLSLLNDAFKFKVKLFHVLQPELRLLESRFYKAYAQFVLYEEDVEDFVTLLSQNTASSPGSLGILEKYFNTVGSQRDALRILLQETGRV